MDPAARMLSEGAHALCDVELVSLVAGCSKRAAAEVCEEGLASLRRARPFELLCVPGLSDTGACRIAAALELGIRAVEAKRRSAKPAKDSDAAAALLWPRLVGLAHEEFWALLLNARLDALRQVRIASGGITACSVLPREAFAPALLHGAAAVVFAHNHPSGEPRPSADDLRLQERLDEAGRALGIEVLDHLVLAESGFHSTRAGFCAPPRSPFAGAQDVG